MSLRVLETLQTQNINYSSLAKSLAIIAILCLSLNVLVTYWRLRYVPGPLWARLTNLQRVWWVKTGRAHEIHNEMHDKYGTFVRFGPNTVSVSDPEAIATLYPMRMGFVKGAYSLNVCFQSDFYKAQMPYSRNGGAMTVVFNSRDEKVHKELKFPIASLYSTSRAMTLEHFVDRTLKVMFQQLDHRFIETKQVFDLGDWVQFFAFDVMGTLTFSRRYGFLDQGQDVDGLLDSIWTFFQKVAPMTQIPWFDTLWNKNAFVASFKTPTGLPILRIVDQFLTERRNLNQKEENLEDDLKSDMMSRFLEIQRTKPGIPEWGPRAWTFSNVVAGSDSTGNTMRTIVYNLLAHPQTLRRLEEELFDLRRQGNLSQPFPAFKEVRDLPYLDACVWEALRIHPPFALPLERVIPEGGATVCGQFFPAGTAMGMSAYVANRHKPTFGEDVEKWRPERWTEADPQQRQKMLASIMTFGAGRRVCLGQNIAMLEIKKLIPALFTNYEFHLIDPLRYKIHNAWMVKQWGVDVTVTRRDNLQEQA
ncbi:unnamed protein product [Penicillium salamii]|nr:unnamed protein product [Penicillium salamii]